MLIQEDQNISASDLLSTSTSSAMGSCTVKLRSYNSTSELTDLLASVSPEFEGSASQDFRTSSPSDKCCDSLGIRSNCKRKIRQLMKIAWQLHNEKLLIEAELEEMNAVWESFLGFSVFEPGEEDALIEEICVSEAEAHHLQPATALPQLHGEMHSFCTQFNELMECENECVNIAEELVDCIVTSVQRYYKAATGSQESMACIMRSCNVKSKYLKISASTQALIRRIVSTENLVAQDMSPTQVRNNLLSLLDLDARSHRLNCVTRLVTSTLEFRHFTEREMQKLLSLCSRIEGCLSQHTAIAAALLSHHLPEPCEHSASAESTQQPQPPSPPHQQQHQQPFHHLQRECPGACAWLQASQREEHDHHDVGITERFERSMTFAN